MNTITNNIENNIIYDKSGAVESASFRLDPISNNYYLTIKFNSFKSHFRLVDEKDEFLIDGDRFKINFPPKLLSDLSLCKYKSFVKDGKSHDNCRKTAEVVYILDNCKNLKHFACFSCPLRVWSINKKSFEKEHPDGHELSKVVFQNDYLEGQMDITYLFYKEDDLMDWLKCINYEDMPSKIAKFLTHTSLPASYIK